MSHLKTKFSFDTIEEFDKHIELSVPNYAHIHEIVQSMSTYFIKPDSHVIDLGCSTGSLLFKLKSKNEHIKGVWYDGYDISNNLLPEIDGLSTINFFNTDITKPEERFKNSSLILSIFTLQFLSIKDRWDLCKKIYNDLNPGGAFIVCEKVFLKDGFMQDLFTFSYYDYKQKAFTEKEILDKQKDLREIMQPQTEAQNKIMFREAGFDNIECFFSSLLFKGWILCK